LSRRAVVKIKLNHDLPVARECGCVEGRVMQVLSSEVFGGRSFGRVMWWVRGDNGERVGVQGQEAAVVEWDWLCQNCGERFVSSYRSKSRVEECPVCRLDEIVQVYPAELE
jgi:hypothetical protein